MAKRNPFRAAEDDAVEIDMEPSRKFKGSDEEPVDAGTGEELFDDLNPHFNAKLDRVAAKEQKKERQRAGEDEDFDDEQDSDELVDADDEDEVDEPNDTRDDVESEDNDDEDDEPAPRGKRDKRLERERRLREEAEDNYNDLRARQDAMEAKLNAQASDSEFETFKSSQEAKIAAVRVKLAAAKEAGNTEDDIRLTDELVDLRSELRSRDQQRSAAKENIQKRVQEPSPIVARKVAQWTRKHTRYHRDMVFQDFVKSVDKQLAKEGYNPESDEYFRALDKEVRRRYPEEYRGEKAERREREEAPRRRNAPTANFAKTARTTPAKKGEFQRRGSKVQLTPAQAANMRRFRLDPSNPNDVKEYVTNNLS